VAFWGFLSSGRKNRLDRQNAGKINGSDLRQGDQMGQDVAGGDGKDRFGHRIDAAREARRGIGADPQGGQDLGRAVAARWPLTAWLW